MATFAIYHTINGIEFNINNQPDLTFEIVQGGMVIVDQLQSDWNQTNNTEKDFIKNKPTIPTIDPNTVIDADYNHTDNNYTDEDVLEVAKIVDKQNITDNTLETTAQTIAAAINEVRTIALGADIAFVFDTKVAMEAWLLIPENVALLEVGNLFLIRELTVPDYWWDGVSALELEVKINLTNYYTKLEIETLFPNETPSTIGALIETTELETITDTTKIAGSVGGVVNWFSGLRIKEFLTGFFGKLSTINTWDLLQTFTSGIKTTKIIPNSDTTGVVISNADDTSDIITINTSTKSISIEEAANRKAFVIKGGGQETFGVFAGYGGAQYAFANSFVQGANGLCFGWAANNDIAINSTGGFFASASSDARSTRDIALKRSAAGVWEINNGTAGQYRDLKLRKTIQTGILEYADNAAALAAGLTAGMQYRTGDLLKIVH